ncbi:hypothetical protein B0O99DRAFT_627474 [Bisporella sp. PMI_857]|nr:hypothetical protein B0O99DRAFT_627474 [Bisporella sp. PMI_857]
MEPHERQRRVGFSLPYALRPKMPPLSQFHAMKAYNWAGDSSYQAGLAAILGNTTSNDPSRLEALTLQAQVYFWSRKSGVKVDLQEYKSFLLGEYDAKTTESAVSSRSNSSSNLDSNALKSVGNAQTSTTTVKPPQSSAPALSTTIQDAPPPPAAPYPPTFAEVVALIQSGAEIPGIKEIPDVILKDQGTSATAARRLKPWEKVKAEEVKDEGTFGDDRDKVIAQEYPET